MDNNINRTDTDHPLRQLTVAKWEELARREQMSREHKRRRREEWRENQRSHARRA